MCKWFSTFFNKSIPTQSTTQELKMSHFFLDAFKQQTQGLDDKVIEICATHAILGTYDIYMSSKTLKELAKDELGYESVTKLYTHLIECYEGEADFPLHNLGLKRIVDESEWGFFLEHLFKLALNTYKVALNNAKLDDFYRLIAETLYRSDDNELEERFKPSHFGFETYQEMFEEKLNWRNEEKGLLTKEEQESGEFSFLSVLNSEEHSVEEDGREYSLYVELIERMSKMIKRFSNIYNTNGLNYISSIPLDECEYWIVVSANEEQKSDNDVFLKRTANLEKPIENVSYTEDDHLKGKPQEIVDLYNQYKQAILALDSNIVVNPVKMYVGFKLDKSNVVVMWFRKTKLIVGLLAREGELDDPQGLLEKSHCNLTSHQDLNITNMDNFGYIMGLIRQVLNKKV